MKYLLIALLALTACSKPNDTPAPDNKVNIRASIMTITQVSDQQRQVDVALNFDKNVTTTGSVTVEWDEFSASSFIKHRMQVVPVSLNNAKSVYYETSQSVLHPTSSRNIAITNISLSGGYQWTH